MVTVAGATTMVVGAYRAVQETDLKRILAYSTLSALGVLTMLLGVGTREAIIAALVYLVAHAGYKGALFLVAGAIDHETGTRDISALAGLRRAMPLTALAGGAAALSMAGVPLTLGFVGKDGAYEALLHASDWYPWLLALIVLASILLGLAGLLAGVLPFRGRGADEGRSHDPAWPLWLPPLAPRDERFLCRGIAPSILNGPLSSRGDGNRRHACRCLAERLARVTPALLLSVSRSQLSGSRTWCMKPFGRGRGSRGTEPRICTTGALSALNAVSRAIAPALHSASLRTYVMVIVATSVLVGGAALVTDPGPRLCDAAHQHHCPRCPHRLVIIVGGAIAATLAQSTMAAVLSLGAVGYGVAMMFLSFGAPDLAMTQFSVETLTVLIYVLVFRHFRGLGPLSPRLVRARDGLIAVGIGIFIGGLLVSVATTETARRLQEYFAEFGPTLGHGRNIVNVILVDFRGVRHTRRNHCPGNCGTWRSWVAAIRSNPSTGPLRLGSLTSPIFRTAARLLMPLLLVFSVFLLLRGHNQPGGGFVGGLVAAAAFALYAIAFGVHRARQALLVRPLTLLGAGLLIALRERCACRSSWTTVLDRAVGSRSSARSGRRPCSTSACFSSSRVWC